MANAARLAGWAVCALASFPALAARPFNTDDARIVDPGGYQIETYVKDQRRRNETEYWFLPALNAGGSLERFEFTLGGNVVRSAPEGDSNLVVGQVKTLLVPLEPNGLGLALSLGVNRSKQASSETRYSPYFNAIASVSLADDAVVVHFNAGATRERADHLTRRNWGAGSEIRVTERVFAIAETYGRTLEKPARQVGVRLWAVPKRLQIDGTYGWQDGPAEKLRWVSVGLRILW